MSAPRTGFQIAPRASADLRSIWLYGRRGWGEAVADAYHAALTRAFETLRDNPGLGPQRDDLRPGLQALTIQQHRILYRVTDETVVVLRVIHQRRDAATQTTEPSS